MIKNVGLTGKEMARYLLQCENYDIHSMWGEANIDPRVKQGEV
ncbi:MAG: hypothetical protein ACTSVE_10810 [Candidatus Helarchaeota archaeon]